jgi:hypothetical protein
MPAPDRTSKSTDAGQAPWGSGRPNRALVGAADRIAGAALDIGRGTGENALSCTGR